MPRVLFLAPQPFFRLRGMCIAQRRCLDVLSGSGLQVDLLTFPFGEDVDVPGVRLLRLRPVAGVLDIPIGPSWQKAVMDVPMLLRALWLCLLRRYPIVHACEEMALLMAPFKRALGFKLIYDMDDILSARLERSGFLRSRPLLGLARLLERRALASADLVLTNSRDTTDYARRFARPDAVIFYDHMPTLPTLGGRQNGRRRALRRELGLETGPTVLYAGNFEPYQGIDLLLESLPKVFDAIPDARCLVIGGEPRQIEAARRAAEALAIESRVDFLGKRSLDEAFRHMQAADALVSPMTQEKAVPMKAYAYMSSGTPIVATDLPNHTQLLDETTAVLVPASPGDLADAILRVLRSPEWARDLSDHAREAATVRFDQGTEAVALGRGYAALS